MGKKIFLFSFVIILAVAWSFFHKSGENLERLDEQISELQSQGDPLLKALALSRQYTEVEGQRIFLGILLTLLTTGFVGIFSALYFLPWFAQKMTNSIYSSDEEIENDGLRHARVFMAKGKWEDAIHAFREASLKNPLNRTPYLEIAKIQKNQLGNPEAALQTFRSALENEVWSPDDAAFFMFRMVEMYDQDLGERGAAVILLEQIIEQFPATRYSANATTKLDEWGMA